jgi:hypothetical protein
VSVTRSPQEQAKQAAAPAEAFKNGIANLLGLWLVALPRQIAPWLPQVAATLADGAWSAAWRNVAGLSPVVGLLLGLAAPSVFPGVDRVYFDSLPFLLIAIAGAILSGPSGATLLLGYVVGDVVRGGGELGRQYLNSSPFGLTTALREGGSQVLAYLLLAIPVVNLPRFAGSLSRSVSAKLPVQVNLETRWVRFTLYPLLCGLLVFIWSQGMLVLSRPVFTWRGVALSPDSLATFRDLWPWLVLTAVIAALARVGLEGVVERWAPWRTTVARIRHVRQLAMARQTGRGAGLPLPLRILLPTGVITLLLSGLYDGWTDALLVALVSAVLSAVRAGAGGPWTARLSASVQRVPALVRLLIVLAIGYVGFGVLQLVDPSLAAASPSRPLLAAAIFSLVGSYLLFPSRRMRQLAGVGRRLNLPGLTN